MIYYLLSIDREEQKLNRFDLFTAHENVEKLIWQQIFGFECSLKNVCRKLHNKFCMKKSIFGREKYLSWGRVKKTWWNFPVRGGGEVRRLLEIPHFS